MRGSGIAGIAGWTTAGLLLAWGLACAPPARVPYEEQLQDAAPAARHAIAGEQLAQHMRGLERLSRGRLPRAIDKSAELRRSREETTSLALAMAEAARQIPEAAPLLDIDDEERAEFLFLAEVLERRSNALAAEAPYLSASQIRERTAVIQETCDHCHGRFRISRGRL